MQKLHHVLFLFLLFGLLGLSWPFPWSTPHASVPLGSGPWLSKEMQTFKSQARNIDDKVLRLSLIAYLNARRKGMDHKQMLTVIDYSKPSTERRLWVFDLKSGRTLFNTWVSHGKNSGGVNATSFSNSNGSLKSSIGVFLTEEPYVGKNGYSLRLKGLERGVNDNALDRAVVIHGARYVNADTIRKYGKIGRSWGCPAVSTSLSKPLIDTVKNNTLIVAYYPDRKWLSNSKFLTG